MLTVTFVNLLFEVNSIFFAKMVQSSKTTVIPKTSWTLDDLLVLNGIKKLQSIGAFIAQQYSSIADVLAKPSKHPIVKKFQSLSKKDLHAEIQRGIEYADHQRKYLEKNYNVVSYFDEQYPSLLRGLDYPSLLLFYKGQLPDQSEYSRSLTIVGTRTATQYGKLQTERYIQALGQYGFIFCSGNATGIDSTVHKYCIQSQLKSYAFVACGLDKISPELSKSLMKKVSENGGAVISEFPFGEPAYTYNFIKRNRLLSGFSHATFIVESAEKGGSLITARISFEQNRPVYGLPGNISTNTSMGVNTLIKQCKAVMTLRPEDILEDLGIQVYSENNNNKTVKFDTNEEELIYSTLSYDPMHIDEISEKTDLSPSIIYGSLLAMELHGFIRQVPGSMYIRT